MGASTRLGVCQPRRLRPLALVGVLAAAAIAGLAIGALLSLALRHRRAAPRSVAAARVAVPELHGQATWPAGARAAPAITTLRDQTGRLFSLASLRGQTVAMVFFDSFCHQACPLEGRALAAAASGVPAAQRPTLVVVSVNPSDTPASTRAAMRSFGLARLATWHWLRGTNPELARVWAAYRIFVAPPRSAGGDIIHTEALYLIDRRGFERSAYLYPFMPAFVRADLTKLAVERRS